jgi:hypothetical protein
MPGCARAKNPAASDGSCLGDGAIGAAHGFVQVRSPPRSVTGGLDSVSQSAGQVARSLVAGEEEGAASVAVGAGVEGPPLS